MKSLCMRCANGTAFKRAADRGHADPPRYVACRVLRRFMPPDIEECSDFVERYLTTFYAGMNQAGTADGLIVDPRERPTETYL